MRLHLTTSKPYDFAASVQDYGWIDLAPCQWLEDVQTFQRIERLSTGKVVKARVIADGNDLANGTSDQAAHNLNPGVVTLVVQVEPAEEITAGERAEIEANLSWMLRLDEDLEPFYQQAQNSLWLWSQVKNGRGRLLRSSTLFEDVVKTICTTNTTWRQTKGMVARLVDLLGSPFPLDPSLHAFPTPIQIAAVDPSFLQEEVRLGYRSAYVHRLAQEIVSGKRDLEVLCNGNLTTPELKIELKTIKGVGEYAANNLLMLLGTYSHLALDSEMRAFVSERYFDGRPAADADILSIYEAWDSWRYLAYWFDSIA